MNVFLGVDGGASKTAALVIDESGKSLGTGVAGPSNHLRVGIETAARNIERAVNKALTGAIGFGAGVVVIAGTGSVAFGRNEAGEEARAGGWGPIIGDEGSGYFIARAGLAAIMRAHDGRGPATKMTEILKERFDMKPEDLPPFVYATSTQT